MLAFSEVLQMANYWICVNLYASFSNEGHRGVALKDMLWAAVSTYTEGEFTMYMEELKRMKKECLRVLEQGGP